MSLLMSEKTQKMMMLEEMISLVSEWLAYLNWKFKWKSHLCFSYNYNYKHSDEINTQNKNHYTSKCFAIQRSIVQNNSFIWWKIFIFYRFLIARTTSIWTTFFWMVQIIKNIFYFKRLIRIIRWNLQLKRKSSFFVNTCIKMTKIIWKPKSFNFLTLCITFCNAFATPDFPFRKLKFILPPEFFITLYLFVRKGIMALFCIVILNEMARMVIYWTEFCFEICKKIITLWEYSFINRWEIL